MMALLGWQRWCHHSSLSLIPVPVEPGVSQLTIPLISARPKGSFMQLGTYQGLPSCQEEFEFCPGTHSVEGRVAGSRVMCHSRAHPKSKPPGTQKGLTLPQPAAGQQGSSSVLN